MWNYYYGLLNKQVNSVCWIYFKACEKRDFHVLLFYYKANLV